MKKIIALTIAMLLFLSSGQMALGYGGNNSRQKDSRYNQRDYGRKEEKQNRFYRNEKDQKRGREDRREMKRPKKNPYISIYRPIKKIIIKKSCNRGCSYNKKENKRVEKKVYKVCGKSKKHSQCR